MGDLKEDSYVHISAFMVNDLKLSGNELIIYAIIYGFSQDGESWFTGSRKYLASWCGTSKRAVTANLKKLTDKGLIERRLNPIQDMIHHDYRALRPTSTPPKNVQGGVEESSPPPSEDSSTHNIVGNTLEENKSIMLPGFLTDEQIAASVIQHLNEVAGTDYDVNAKPHHKLIIARIKDGHAMEQFIEVIDKKCAQWIGTDYETYLRPSTLFAKKHFDEYLNQPWNHQGGRTSNGHRLSASASEQAEHWQRVNEQRFGM